MKKINLAIFIISIIGMLFSGYLAYSKLFSGVCALNEGCLTFLGYPTCLFGFIFFLLLFIVSLLSFKRNGRLLLILISGLAVIFSGYFSIIDLTKWTGHYSLLLPSCIYGFIMFVVVFILSLKK